MKIVENSHNKAFEDLELGDVFMYEQEYYMKTDETLDGDGCYNAV